MVALRCGKVAVYTVRCPRSTSLTGSRMHSIQQHRPITLHATIRPPLPNEVYPDQQVTAGLACMVELYKNIDSTFVDLWNGVQHHADPSWVCRLQTDLLQAVPEYLQYTEYQAVEIRVTQHWLRAVVWRLCSSRESTGSSTGGSMPYLCPVRIAMGLGVALEEFSQAAVRSHGDGLVSFVTGFPVSCAFVPSYTSAARACLCRQLRLWRHISPENALPSFAFLPST